MKIVYRWIEETPGLLYIDAQMLDAWSEFHDALTDIMPMIETSEELIVLVVDRRRVTSFEGMEQMLTQAQQLIGMIPPNVIKVIVVGQPTLTGATRRVLETLVRIYNARYVFAESVEAGLALGARLLQEAASAGEDGVP